MAMGRPLRLLCVCTHNQTRSVLMGAFIRRHANALGLPVLVRTGGFTHAGKGPTSEVTRRLATLGVDVSDHRSTAVVDSVIEKADLILTAEQDHVVNIAAQVTGSFRKTFSLPEFLRHALVCPPDPGSDFDTWLDAIDAQRPGPMEYLSATIEEIADPTGGTRGDWKGAVATIEEQTRDLCRVLAQVPGNGSTT